MAGLDGLRAIAVTAVVWHHTHPGFSFLPQSNKGFLGVDVFFVLSGFLITTLLLQEKARSGRISLSHFYLRRSLRIFPLYYAVLAALALYFSLIAPDTSRQREAFLAELPYHASYLSDWVETKTLMSITWSLSAEEQFYLLWPPLLVWLGRRAIWPLALLLCVNQAVNFGALDGWLDAIGLPYATLSILQSTFTPIFLGAMLAFAMQEIAARQFMHRLTCWPVLLAMLAVALAATGVNDMRGAPRLAFHMAITALLAGIVLRPGMSVVRWLEWRPLAFVGTVSYGIYLLHKIVLDVLSRGFARAELKSPALLFVLCLLGTIGLAALSYRYFERPILRVKDRFR